MSADDVDDDDDEEEGENSWRLAVIRLEIVGPTPSGYGREDGRCHIFDSSGLAPFSDFVFVFYKGTLHLVLL